MFKLPEAPTQQTTTLLSNSSCDHPIVLMRRALRFKGIGLYSTPQRFISRHVILYIKQGSGELMINRMKLRITGGQLFLFAPGMQIAVHSDVCAEWDSHCLVFDLKRSSCPKNSWSIGEFGPFHLAAGGELQVADQSVITRLFDQIYATDDGSSGLFRWKRQIALTDLFYTLLQDNATADVGLQINTMRVCADYIDRHYAENIRMEKLAEMSGLNSSAFSRLFKQSIGMTPSDYLLHTRIAAAKSMLRPDVRMREVAQKVGFCDEFYFSRMFKKVVGVAPSLYIRKVQGSMLIRNRPGMDLEAAGVAATYIDEADHLIALGLLPAAVPADHALDESEVVIPYLERYLSNVPRIGCELSIDTNELDRIKPDLIIAGRFLKNWGITGFDEIARTHYYYWEVDWRNTHRDLARLLGREMQAEHNIAQFNRLVGEARERMRAVCIRRRFAFLEVTREGIRVSPYMSNGGWLLFELIGLIPSAIVSVNNWDHFVEAEEVEAIPADYIFIGRRSGSQRVYEAMFNHPGVQGIRSKIVELPRYPWGKGGPIAYTQGVRFLLSLFEKLHK
ncbi:AraC family transcriptional regulator [Paenibacillaceae bacterium]|nr:AraC family transcriptional regulator [Paenibacillaceae bacterium]